MIENATQSGRDRPVDSADESPKKEFIQVTPEMIAAGVREAGLWQESDGLYTDLV